MTYTVNVYYSGGDLKYIRFVGSMGTRMICKINASNNNILDIIVFFGHRHADPEMFNIFLRAVQEWVVRHPTLTSIKIGYRITHAQIPIVTMGNQLMQKSRDQSGMRSRVVRYGKIHHADYDMGLKIVVRQKRNSMFRDLSTHMIENILSFIGNGKTVVAICVETCKGSVYPHAVVVRGCQGLTGRVDWSR